MPATFALVAAGFAVVTLPQVSFEGAPAATDGGPPLSVGQVEAVSTVDVAPPAATNEPPEPKAPETKALEPKAPEPAGPVTFAAVEGLELVLPGADVVAHGFHEAAGSGPETLDPIGTRRASEPPDAAEATDATATDTAPEFLVMPSRHRGTAPTSAVDIVLRDGDQVLAPVDGVVSTVTDYQLYGSTTDTLVYIRPTEAPHLRVEVLHLEGTTVAEGDQVRAGETVVANTARRLGVRNQIDRFVGESLPHVHIEVTQTEKVA